MISLIQTVSKLNQRVELLIKQEKKLEEENIFFKEELKQIKEEITYILLKLNNKQISKHEPLDQREIKNNIIKSISKLFEKEGLHEDNEICSIILLSENNIITGGGDGSLYLWECDCILKTLTKLSEEKNAHDDVINFLNKINEENRILSCSNDYTIKLWDISKQIQFQLLRTFKGHNDIVEQVIHIEINQQLASNLIGIIQLDYGILTNYTIDNNS